MKRVKDLKTITIDHAVTGAHIFNETVVINADVRGATIQAQGHVIIAGSVQHSALTSALGSVFILYGTSRHTQIEAHQNIYVKHASDSILQAEGDVVIETSILRSQIKAGGSVIDERRDAAVVGGEVVGGREIRIDVIGNDQGVKTRIQLTDEKGVVRCRRIFPNAEIQIGDHRVKFKHLFEGGRMFVDDGRLKVVRSA